LEVRKNECLDDSVSIRGRKGGENEIEVEVGWR